MRGENEKMGVYKILYNSHDQKVYEGEFEDDVREGRGNLYYPSGSVKYTGEWKSDRPHGMGVLFYENGNKFYEGRWEDGKALGQGVLFCESGLIEYEGQFLESKKNGIGVMYFSDGSKYKGEWKDDEMNGFGSLFYPTGELCYRGTWKNSKKDGNGAVLSRDNILIYQGNFVDDKKCGRGKSYYDDGTLQYSGQWQNNKMCGEGILYDENGEKIFNGFFDNGKKISASNVKVSKIGLDDITKTEDNIIQDNEHNQEEQESESYINFDEDENQDDDIRTIIKMRENFDIDSELDDFLSGDNNEQEDSEEEIDELDNEYTFANMKKVFEEEKSEEEILDTLNYLTERDDEVLENNLEEENDKYLDDDTFDEFSNDDMISQSDLREDLYEEDLHEEDDMEDEDESEEESDDYGDETSEEDYEDEQFELEKDALEKETIYCTESSLKGEKETSEEDNRKENTEIPKDDKDKNNESKEYSNLSRNSIEEGNFRYEGNFNNFSKTGNGTVFFKGRKIYTGNIVMGAYEGEGKLYDSDGNIVYDGQFKDGKRNGKGKSFDCAKNVIYDGEWKDDLQHGHGRLLNSNGNEIYKGSFHKSKALGLVNSIETEIDNILYGELEGMVGLEEVKDDIARLVSFLKMQILRRRVSYKIMDIPYIFTFEGNVGVGKEEVAKILGKLYYVLGLIPEYNFIQKDLSEVLDYSHEGGIENAMDNVGGGVLYLSNLYENDFDETSILIKNKAAINNIIDLIDYSNGHFVVIFSGDEDLIETMIHNKKELAKLIGKSISFFDYSASEMIDYMKNVSKEKEYILQDDLLDALLDFFEDMLEDERTSNTNAEFLKELFTELVKQQCIRIDSYGVEKVENLKNIKLEDFKNIEHKICF